VLLCNIVTSPVGGSRRSPSI